jgi:hypothetical protein
MVNPSPDAMRAMWRNSRGVLVGGSAVNVAGEVIYGRFNDAYQSAFPIAQLTKSYEQKQSTIDSLLESGFRLFVTVIGPLVALFTAILRYAP